MTKQPEFLIEPHDPGDLADMQMAMEITNVLQKHYPGYPWAVNVNSGETAGVVNIFNWAISSRYGYVLHLTTVQNDPTLKCVVLAGGEILERGKLLRGEAQGEFAEQIDGAPDKHQPTRGTIQ